MSIKSGATGKLVKKTLVELSGGVDCPNFKFRPGSKDTTAFGWDFGTVIDGKPFLRFHRAVDRGALPANIFTPVAFDGALFSTNAGDYGNLLRLIYLDTDHHWELRIAHLQQDTDVDPAFLKLVKIVPDKDAKKNFMQNAITGLTPIPAGIRIGQPGKFGLSNGIHTHTELLSVGGRNKGLDQLLEAKNKPVGKIYKIDTKEYREYLAAALFEATKVKLTDEHYANMLKYLKDRGYSAVGPYEAHGWDGRTNTNSIWYSSRATLNI